MKFLKEAFGESEELNTFVSQIERRFRKYYEVTLSLNGNESRRYFAFEEAAKKYYDGLVNEANSDKEYYDGASVRLTAVEILRDEDELDSILIDKEENFEEI